ncbi:MAG: peptidase S9 family protein [Bacteroidetes bacterium]|nr:MAG: peptidase S9 family protein [Bacteroidota bacterium]
MKKCVLSILIISFLPFALFAQQVKRSLRPSDIYRIQNIDEPECSPDGQWIAYTLATADSTTDKINSDIWMVSFDGKQDIQLTYSDENESKPRWSPDGKYLAFLSARYNAKGSQLWLMDRRGGEAKKITDFKSGIENYSWAPDGKKLLLTINDAEPEDTSKPKTTKPYVIDRYQYKRDYEGYRYKKLFTHLYLMDVATKKLDTLTNGSFNESEACFSPDGAQIAFVSNRTEDPDKNENSDIFIIDAKPGSKSKQITQWKGFDQSPKWSPDGKWIAYTRSTSEGDFLMYDESVLAVVSKDGGETRLLSKDLDRPVNNIRWSSDGKNIFAIVVDDRQQYVASFSFASGQMSKVADGQREFSNLEKGKENNWIALISESQIPEELYVLENGKTRRLTNHQDEFVKPLDLATAEGFESTSKDGTKVSGILYLPANAVKKDRLPLILFIHGGPVGQNSYGFDLFRQMLAGAGYAVAAVNYRGSSGRGLDYCKAIFADWGNKEVIDLHGAVDYLVKKGIADPDKLGVGGWSYGGILTDYLIASDTRFKAACSGAGTGFTLSLYGVDQYIGQYTNEIGPPWKSIDKYLKISYPLLQADKIKTPTLFMSGEKDFNVPTAGSEQMYQALRSTGVETQLIIYPGQFHGISVPSYQKDRLERYIAWYRKYLK